MRTLHYSDTHLPPSLASVPLADWLSKRVTGALSHLMVRRQRFSSVRHKIARLAHLAEEEGVELVMSAAAGSERADPAPRYTPTPAASTTTRIAGGTTDP